MTKNDPKGNYPAAEIVVEVNGERISADVSIGPDPTRRITTRGSSGDVIVSIDHSVKRWVLLSPTAEADARVANKLHNGGTLLVRNARTGETVLNRGAWFDQTPSPPEKNVALQLSVDDDDEDEG